MRGPPACVCVCVRVHVGLDVISLGDQVIKEHTCKREAHRSYSPESSPQPRRTDLAMLWHRAPYTPFGILPLLLLPPPTAPPAAASAASAAVVEGQRPRPPAVIRLVLR